MKAGTSSALRLATLGLWLRALMIAALAVYTVTVGGPAFWLPLTDYVAAALAVALWAPLMARYLRGQPVLTTDPRRAVLLRFYPWLLAYEATLWLLFSFMPAVSGYFPEVNPVASAAQVTVSGVSVTVSFLIYLLSLRQMTNPADGSGKTQLGDLFNLAAALSAASVVFSVVPPRGMPAPSVADMWAYALANGAELLSWLLLRWALRGGGRAATGE